MSILTVYSMHTISGSPCNLGNWPQGIHDPALTGCIQGKHKKMLSLFLLEKRRVKMKKIGIAVFSLMFVGVAYVGAQSVEVDFNGENAVQNDQGMEKFSMPEAFADIEYNIPMPKRIVNYDIENNTQLIQRDKFKFLFLKTEKGKFCPISDLKQLKILLEAIPRYLDDVNLSFESHLRILKIMSEGRNNLDIMLAKYSDSKTQITRADFLVEIEPTTKSLLKAYTLLKGTQDGGSGNDNCWSDCSESCHSNPSSLGDVVCHMTCYYVCETT